MSTTQQHIPQFKVGDWVTLPYGLRQVWAQVVEDRGSLGVNRRRLYRVRLDQDPGESLTFEVPEGELTPARPSKEAVVNYLAQGGLLYLLRSNLGGGPNPPRAWLTLDSRGRVSGTFDAERGIIGGEVVPFFALHQGRIFTPMADQVVDFLLTFGLTRSEAEVVVRSVGTSP